LYKDIRLRARDQANIAEFPNFFGRYRNADIILGASTLRVTGYVSGEPGKVSFNFRRRSLIKRMQPDARALPERQLVYILRQNAGFELQTFFIWHNEHDGLP
jgi:hypothetical protein